MSSWNISAVHDEQLQMSSTSAVRQSAEDDHFAVVIGVLLLRARRPGIRCQTVFMTQLLSLDIFRHQLKTHLFAKHL